MKDVSVIQVDGIMWSEKYGKECWDYLRIKNKVLKKHSVLVEKSGNGVFIKYENKKKSDHQSHWMMDISSCMINSQNNNSCIFR